MRHKPEQRNVILRPEQNLNVDMRVRMCYDKYEPMEALSKKRRTLFFVQNDEVM